MTDRSETADRVKVFPLDDAPDLAIVEAHGEGRAVIYPGVGATHRAFHHIRLYPGGRTVSMAHPGSEAVYFVSEGSGSVLDQDTEERLAVRAGHMFFVDPGSRYRLCAGADTGVTFVGGPCPPDSAVYRSHALR